MTDEQWIWLFINQLIDNDEQLEKMCDKCREEVTSNRCNRCGTSLNSTFVNPNFDKSKFESLSSGNEYDEETSVRLVEDENIGE